MDSDVLWAAAFGAAVALGAVAYVNKGKNDKDVYRGAIQDKRLGTLDDIRKEAERLKKLAQQLA